MEAEEIVRKIREQNWKNGGALVMDVDEAVKLVAEALQDRFDTGFCAAGGTITPLKFINREEN